MICSNCGQEVPVAGQASPRYCPWCGAPLPAEDAVPGEPVSTAGDGEPDGPDAAQSGSSDDELRELRATVNAMTGELARLSLRLQALERQRGSTSAPNTAPESGPSISLSSSSPPPSTRPPNAPPAPTVASPMSAPDDATEDGPAPARPATPSPGDERDAPSLPRTPSLDLSGWNWEWLLGGNWLARIGIVALIFGVAFFISLAIDRGWLGETQRVLLGVFGGIAFLGAGEYWRRRYAVWAQTVTGGGLAILYLSVYGAFALYGLISPTLAFGAFSLITLAGALLSLRHEAVAVGVFSIFGGFATPLLLQERLPDQRLLLAYVLVLDMGILALAGFRNWRWFTLLAWAGSLVLFAFWESELKPPTALAQIGITVIFLIFAAATVIFHLVRRQAANIADLALITLNAAGYYGISYFLIYDEFRPWMGGFTALLGVFYTLLAAGIRMRGEAQLNLTLFSAGLAVVFAVLAVPIQLGGPWISVAWGLEGLALTWMSFPLRMRELRWAGYAVFAVSAAWLLGLDTPDALNENLTPFANWYTLSYAATIALPVLAGYLLHRNRDSLAPVERYAVPAFAFLAAVIGAVLIPVQLEGIWIPVGWAVEAGTLLALSWRLPMRELRWLGYGLLAAMLARLLAVDTFSLNEATFRPVWNWRFLAFAVGIVALYGASWLARRRREDADNPIEKSERRWAMPTLLTAASAATLWLLSAEIVNSAYSAYFNLPEEARENVASLGLSLLWVAYAAALITLGMIRRLRWVRLAGLAVLAVPVVKLFAYDSRTLEQEYRVIAFIALGLILLAGGFLYQRHGRAVRGFLFE